MNLRLKRARELAGYAVQLTKDEGLPTMLKRGAGFVKRRCFGKKARYLPAKKVLEAQRAEMAGKTAADCGLPTISILIESEPVTVKPLESIISASPLILIPPIPVKWIFAGVLKSSSYIVVYFILS